MNFKHFLVTRFNLRVDSWETTKNGQPTLTDEWLNERFRLFEDYCLPSVLQQSEQEFTWRIFFDISTRKHQRERIEAISARYKNIRLFYIDGINQLPSFLLTYIKKATGDQCKFVITTRLDNDDLLHRDFIKTIQQNFVPIHQTVIDLRSGYQLCIKNKFATFRVLNNEFNPFISLVEETKRAETVLSRMHRHWATSANLVVVLSKRLWVELVHRSNKLNDVNESCPKVHCIELSDFGLDERNIRIQSKVQFILSAIWKNLPARRLFSVSNSIP